MRSRVSLQIESVVEPLAAKGAEVALENNTIFLILDFLSMNIITIDLDVAAESGILTRIRIGLFILKWIRILEIAKK